MYRLTGDISTLGLRFTATAFSVSILRFDLFLCGASFTVGSGVYTWSSSCGWPIIGRRQEAMMTNEMVKNVAAAARAVNNGKRVNSPLQEH